MATLLIKDKPVFIRSNYDFAEMLEEKLGFEVAQFYRNSVAEAEKPQCLGECDATYRIQEHYERVLRDVQDELTSWKVKKLTKEEICNKRDQLSSMIEKEL